MTFCHILYLVSPRSLPTLLIITFFDFFTGMKTALYMFCTSLALGPKTDIIIIQSVDLSSDFCFPLDSTFSFALETTGTEWGSMQSVLGE
jgi:hypothetical protein